MDDLLTIYIDRLRDGHSEHIKADVAPDFIGIDDEEASFRDPVKVDGEAYLAEDRLVLHLNLMTRAHCRCVICNEKVPVDIRIENAYQVEEIAAIKGAVYDMTALIREMILLEIPAYFECHEGKCPSREQIDSYLKKEISEHERLKEVDEGYHPFKDLSLDNSHVSSRGENNTKPSVEEYKGK